MYVWCLLFGVLSIRLVHSIPENDTTTAEIPESYLKLAEGNSLWYDLLHDCKNTSATCIKKTAYDYLNNLLEYPEDIQVTSNILLEKNDVDFDAISKLSSADDEDDDETFRSTPLEEITHSLHDKAVKFLMTHDVVLRLPEYYFDGAFLRVSPRTFDGGGALIKLNTFPGQGRIFFKKISKYMFIIINSTLYRIFHVSCWLEVFGFNENFQF